jgi:hypothetical protein
MFIQVIQGKCTRQDELRAIGDSWRGEVGAGATGYLGATFGFTDDDLFFGVVRFASREEAMANSARPEQGAWAERFMATFDGPVEFHDCDDVTTFLEGGSDDAGFVQIIQGTVSDRAAVDALLGTTDELKRMRPEVIGGTFAIDEDGMYTQTVAFTSEAAAREGEQTEPPPEVAEVLGKLMADARFYDLHHPWFESA